MASEKILLTKESGKFSLEKRRGMIIFDRELLTKNPIESELKAIFSNFFPVAIENGHSYGLHRDLKMYGYSSYFREIEVDGVCPKYDIYLKRNEDGGVHFDKMVEVV